MNFFYERSVDREVDSAVSARASGFLDYMESFQSIFCLTTFIEIFDRVEILNKDLQKSDLCVVESYEKIAIVTDLLGDSRDAKFEDIWQKCIKAVDDLELSPPVIPRQPKIPKRYNDGSENYVFKSAKEYYRKTYLEIFDQLITSLKSRFDNDSTFFF